MDTKDNLDKFQKLVSTDRDISTSISIGLDRRDLHPYYFVLPLEIVQRSCPRS